MSKIFIYLDNFGEYVDQTLYPKERYEEILACQNEKVKSQKYWAWKLLEKALKEQYNVSINDLSFKKVYTKWITENFYFSISHSNNILALSLGKKENGIDIEKIDEKRFLKLINKSNKLLTNNENEAFSNILEENRANYLNILWTKKESIFKTLNKQCFLPNNIDSNEKFTKTYIVKNESGSYYLSICLDKGDEIEFIYKNFQIAHI